MTTIRYTPQKFRPLARRVALDFLGIATRHRRSIHQRTPTVHFPYLHAVPARSLPAFEHLVESVSVTHELVSYSRAVHLLVNGPIDHPVAAFSFDDGFASNVSCAEILERHGTVGMFFVPTGFIGTQSVAEARRFFGFTEGCNEPAMTWDDLETLKARGHEIGNHTVGHRTLSTLQSAEAVDEIAQGAETLRARLGSVEHFAWPNGRWVHMTHAAVGAVFDTGHSTCASAERGAHSVVHRGRKDRLILRRDHLMADWPLRHNSYFIRESAYKRSGPASNEWPIHKGGTREA